MREVAYQDALDEWIMNEDEMRQDEAFEDEYDD